MHGQSVIINYLIFLKVNFKLRIQMNFERGLEQRSILNQMDVTVLERTTAAAAVYRKLTLKLFK